MNILYPSIQFISLINIITKFLKRAKTPKTVNPYGDVEVHDVYENTPVENQQLAYVEAPQLDYKQYQIHEEPSKDQNQASPTNDDLLERTMESYNNQHLMQKAVFSFDDEVPETNQVYEERNDNLYESNISEEGERQPMSNNESNMFNETVMASFNYGDDNSFVEPYEPNENKTNEEKKMDVYFNKIKKQKPHT